MPFKTIRHITRPGLGLNCDDLLRIAASPS
jgi:hypothetical protein